MPVREHAVQFYENEDELVEAAVPYLAAGLDAGEAVLVIATAAHRLAFEQRLADLGCGVAEALAAGTYLAADATEILRYVRPDPEAEPRAEEFDATVGMLTRRQLRTGRGLRVYGELTGLLWTEDDTAGAIALEEMWSELQHRQQFTLLCAYPGMRSPARREAAREVCRLHSSVLPTITEDGPLPDEASITAVFSPTLESPGRVRALFRAELRHRSLDEDLIERSTLAASELAANAVLHANTPFRLLVRPTQASVWVGVEDGAPLRSRREVAGRMPHGLGMIAALAVRWGVRRESWGKIIWAEIPRER